MRPLPFLLSSALLCAAAPAQFCTGNRLGLLDGFDSPMQADGFSFSHIANLANATTGILLTRLPESRLSHWGLDPGDPTNQTKAIAGFEVLLIDFDASTADSFNLVGFDEDPATPGFPDANPAGGGMFLNSQTLTTPNNQPAGQAFLWYFCIGFGSPQNPQLLTGVADNQDFFFGLGLGNQGINLPADGLAVPAVGNDPMFPPFDDPGRCANLPPLGAPQVGQPAIDQNSYVCSLTVAMLGGNPTSAATYTNDNQNNGYFAQNVFDVLLPASTPGGAALALHQPGSNWPAGTGQPHFMGNYVSNGTPNGLSGFFPSAAAGDLRGTDDLGYAAFAPPGTATMVLLGSGPNRVPGLSLGGLGITDPASTGLVCLDLGGIVNIVSVGVTDAGGRLGTNVSLAGARNALQAIGCTSVFWQAVTLAPGNGGPLVAGTGCARQDI